MPNRGNPPAGLGCVRCHDPRVGHTDGADGSNARLRSGFEPDQLNSACGRCHDGVGMATHAPHYYDSSAAYEASAHAQLLCTACHGVHGARGPHPAMAVRAEESLCYPCHAKASTEFGAAHHHDVDDADQAASGARIECTMCHNPHLASRANPLVSPDNPLSVWTASSPRDFCLACHDGARPDAVKFPASSNGSGWNQSGFVGSRHDITLGGDCTLCHNPHGTGNRSTLLANYTIASSASYSEYAYQICFTCHSASVTVNGENAFKECHKKHVREERAPCILCHNAHAPATRVKAA